MDSVPQPNDDTINFAEIYACLRRDRTLLLGLAFLGTALGIIFTLIVATKLPAVTTLRVTFGFPGMENGSYPNGAKFQPDDLRAPDVVHEAINRLAVQNVATDIASKVRGGISISGFVSNNVIKERDRLRATGQNLPPYFPDEYQMSLSLQRDYPLSVQQRELVLAEVVNAYLQKFRRTYVELPPEFGNAFGSLKNADFVEYELILGKELRTLVAFLDQQIERARLFRASSTGLSFQDLRKQAELFAQIRLNEVLGLIYMHGLSKDRSYAIVKMDYYLQTLQDQERRLMEEEEVVSNLLNQTQSRAQNYVVATKTQAPQGAQPLLEQGFIDSLLANDAYNFLVRRALEAGLAVKRVQADIGQLRQRRERMDSFLKGASGDQVTAMANTGEALALLETGYQDLLNKVRLTLDEYSRQEYADAARITMQAHTTSLLRTLVLGAAVGCVTGVVLALGLSLLRMSSSKSAAM